MATRSLVGPGLCSQAGEVAPQCVSLLKRASEGRAAPGKQTGLRQQALPGVPPPEAHSQVGEAIEPVLGNTVNLTQDLPRATCLGSPLPSLALCLPPEEVVCLGLQVISALETEVVG